ncbi:MAG: hypothetical protein QOI11_3688 [Candidatus Eremiobacteraeota bacterium]|nr:hypothetical protein [Candidatus Eremiobacteraeota bacterium]
MATEAARLPHVSLSRAQWVRLIVVGILVLIALGRVVPDFVRVVYPLSDFGYATDGNGVVVSAPPAVPKRHRFALPSLPHRGAKQHAASKPTPPPAPERKGDLIRIGDRVRIDRITPYDRKPGLAGGLAYTYDNPDRYLPVERAGHERVLHLVARTETPVERAFAVLRILLFLAAVGVGAILFLVKPSIATGSFLFFCLGTVAPTTYIDTVIPNPWQPIPAWIDETLRGMARPALLLFAFCLIDGAADAARERLGAWIMAPLGLAIGTLQAVAHWLLTYEGRPAQPVYDLYRHVSTGVTDLTLVVLAIAIVRGRGLERRRAAWIAAAFVVATLARLVSDKWYPAHIQPWENGLLLSTSVLPIVAVWIAVVRHRFFNVDFVVSRGMVWVAVMAALVVVAGTIEELITFVFIYNSNFAYGVLIAISMAFGALFGRIKDFGDRIVDRFIFRDRHAQREALEFIGGYILDAEVTEDVYRALLHDAAHALKLSFGGILTRRADGSYQLAESENWPPGCEVRLAPGDELIRSISSSRGALNFSGKQSRLIQRSFPHEPLVFAAPIFTDRQVSAIVVYGHNVSGLDLDPEERELLVRVVGNASIALSAIELARYRAAAADISVPLLGSG